MDGAEIHYLSEIRPHVEDFENLKFKQKMEQLHLELKENLQFIEKLEKENLLETYLKVKYE